MCECGCVMSTGWSWDTASTWYAGWRTCSCSRFIGSRGRKARLHNNTEFHWWEKKHKLETENCWWTSHSSQRHIDAASGELFRGHIMAHRGNTNRGHHGYVGVENYAFPLPSITGLINSVILGYLYYEERFAATLIILIILLVHTFQKYQHSLYFFPFCRVNKTNLKVFFFWILCDRPMQTLHSRSLWSPYFTLGILGSFCDEQY